MISNKKSNKTNIEGAKSKRQSVNEEQKSIEFISVQKICQSQYYFPKYVPMVSSIQSPSLQQLYEVLKLNEFVFHGLPETESILKICTKSTWESLTYRVKVGNLETQINVFRMSTNSKNYTPKSIANGQFGKVSHLSYHSTDYVLKSIKVNSDQNLDLGSALREVFMVKLASCLQVGPHFSEIYGYDAILFTDCLQFSMEMCATTYTEKQILQELKSKNLLRSMKILHTLNICHSDIKLDNIGLSARLKKFVFLDFGFTKYVHESPGYKTFAKFEGTYKYSSEEMKKIYLLRNRAFVDLYYNDLHGLQKTLTELEESLLINQVELLNLNLNVEEARQQPQEIQRQQKKAEVSFADVVPFFQLKFSLFKQNYGKAAQIIQSERVLIYTFRKMLYDAANEIRDSKFPESLTGIHEKYVHSCSELQKSNTKIHKFDACLCDYLLQISCEESLSHNQRLKEIAQREDCLSFIQETWGKEVWMQELFFFLDDDASFRQRVIPAKNINILTDLFAFIRANIQLSHGSPLKRLPLLRCKPDPASMLHDVMVMFFDYFYERRKPAILELILPYFIAFCDEYNSEQMEILILKLYESDDKIYVMKNLQFLVGKRLTLLGYERRIQKSNNLQNVRQVYERLKKNWENDNLDINFMQYVEQTLRVMQIANSINNYNGELLKIHQIKSELNAYSIKYKDFQPDVSQILLKMIPIIYEKSLQYLNIKFFKGYDNSNLKTRYFKTKYIKLVQLNVLYLTSNDQSNLLEKIFLQSYFPFSRFQGLYKIGELDESLLQHYLDLRKFHNFGITQLQIGIMLELKSEKDRKRVERFIFTYFEDFPLDRVQSISDIICVLNSYSRLLSIIISYRRPEFQNLQTNLSKKALQFIDWTEFFIEQISRELNDEYTLIKKKQFIYLRKLCYATSLMGLDCIDQAAFVFLDMFTKYSLPSQTAFSHLCEVYQNSHKNDNQDLGEIAREVSQVNTFIYLVTQEVKQLLCSPVAFRPLIVANCEKKGVLQTFNTLLDLLTLLNAENSFFISLHSRPLIDYFLSLFHPSDSNFFVSDILSKYKLNQVIQYPGISILLFQLYLKSGGGSGSVLEKSLAKITLIYCAFGFEQINSNSMTWIKKYLGYEMMKFFGFKKKTKISTQFLFVNKKNFKTFVDKQAKKINKRRTPEEVKNKFQIAMQKVVKYHKSFFFQQVNQI